MKMHLHIRCRLTVEREDEQALVADLNADLYRDGLLLGRKDVVKFDGPVGTELALKLRELAAILDKGANLSTKRRQWRRRGR